jgi:hypothetical protein
MSLSKKILYFNILVIIIISVALFYVLKLLKQQEDVIFFNFRTIETVNRLHAKLDSTVDTNDMSVLSYRFAQDPKLLEAISKARIDHDQVITDLQNVITDNIQ